MTTPNNAAALERLECDMCYDAARQEAEKRHGTAALMRQWANELAALRATLAQPDASWEPSSNDDYDRSIHSNPDASAWADFFVQTFPGHAAHRDLMLGWFANAMMAMHDHLKTKPDALASQPSGEAVAWLVDYPKFPGMRLWSDEASAKEYSAHCGIPAQPLFTHPSADAPGVAVDEAMVERALSAYYRHGVSWREIAQLSSPDELWADMRAALTAALAPKPEGGHE